MCLECCGDGRIGGVGFQRMVCWGRSSHSGKTVHRRCSRSREIRKEESGSPDAGSFWKRRVRVRKESESGLGPIAVRVPYCRGVLTKHTSTRRPHCIVSEVRARRLRGLQTNEEEVVRGRARPFQPTANSPSTCRQGIEKSASLSHKRDNDRPGSYTSAVGVAHAHSTKRTGWRKHTVFLYPLCEAGSRNCLANVYTETARSLTRCVSQNA